MSIRGVMFRSYVVYSEDERGRRCDRASRGYWSLSVSPRRRRPRLMLQDGGASTDWAVRRLPRGWPGGLALIRSDSRSGHGRTSRARAEHQPCDARAPSIGVASGRGLGAAASAVNVARREERKQRLLVGAPRAPREFRSRLAFADSVTSNVSVAAAHATQRCTT